MTRALIGAGAGLLLVGLLGCSASVAPAGVSVPAARSGMHTQQYGPFGLGGCGYGGATAQSVVTTETSVAPAITPCPVAFNTPVLTATPVTTAIPVTRLVAVTDLVPATTAIPTIANITSVAHVPTISAVPVQRPVVMSQFCSPWVPTAAGPAIAGATGCAPVAPACAPGIF